MAKLHKGVNTRLKIVLHTAFGMTRNAACGTDATHGACHKTHNIATFASHTHMWGAWVALPITALSRGVWICRGGGRGCRISIGGRIWKKL